MKTLKEFKIKQMKNYEFAQEYNSIRSEMNAIRAMAYDRTSQTLHQNNSLKSNTEGEKL